MFRIAYLIIFFIWGCTNGLNKKSAYRLASAEVKSIERERPFQKISKENLGALTKFIYGKDTFNLKDYEVIGFKGLESKRNYIFRFNNNNKYILFVCDTLFRVTSVEFDNR